MFSPSEVGHDLTLYAQAWLSDRMRLTSEVAARVAKEPTVRAVHDVRVACRRLREAVAFFRGVPEVPHLSDLDRAAKRLAKSLGTLRELDVAQKQLIWLDLPDGATDAARLKAKIAKSMKKRRRRAAEKSQKTIAKRAGHLRAVIADHAAMHARPRIGEGDPSRGRQLQTFVDAQVADKASLVGKLFEGLDTRASDVTSARHALELHAVRVAIKHWRYTSEIARAVVPRVLYRAHAARLRKLQETGGRSQDLHDLERLVEHELDHLGVPTRDRRPLLSAIRAARRRAALEFIGTLGARVPPVPIVTAV